MIVIKLQGGLGNQMFQYAAANALSVKYKCRLFLGLDLLNKNISGAQTITQRTYQLNIFKNINPRFASSEQTSSFQHSSKANNFFKKIGWPYKKNYQETQMGFAPEFNDLKPPVLLSGYFQSEKYFSNISQSIRRDFTFTPLPSNDQNISNEQYIQSRLTVSVHVRRGDYIEDKAINAIHGTCSIEYYKNAFAYFQKQLPGVDFVFFSDDPAWVENTFLQHLPGSILIQNNDGADSWKDMYLMSKCNHHIIANSSFSWWGAWLNDRKDKIVIAPKIWFADKTKNESINDLIPEGWIRL